MNKKNCHYVVNLVSSVYHLILAPDIIIYTLSLLFSSNNNFFLVKIAGPICHPYYQQ